MAIDLLLTVPISSLVTRDPPLIPDLGLGYVAAGCRQASLSVQVIDWNPRLSEDQYRRRLQEASPKVVGIKVFTVNFREARRTMAVIREELPDVILVAGGPHPTTAPPEYLFEEFPDIDLAFRGEAEGAFPRVLACLREAGWDRARIGQATAGFSQLPGVVWREGDTVRANGTVFEDIRQVGLPAWDLIDPNRSMHWPLDDSGRRNGHVAPLLATRGCPFDCTFCCAHHVNSKTARRRDVDEFLAEIEFLMARFGISQFVVTDSSFMMDRPWVRRLCEEILRRDLDIRWECIYEVQGRIDMEGLDELLALMFRAGCRKLGFSPETISPAVIRRIKKNYDPEALRPVHAMARRHGMATMGFFMIGMPGETLDEVDMTLAYALEEPYDIRFFNVLIPLPGTEVYLDLQRQYGFNRIDWERYRFEKPPFRIGEVPIPALFRRLYKANMAAHFLESHGMGKVASPRPWSLAAKRVYRRVLNW